VTIDQISTSERGNRCDCICETCGLPLVAVLDSEEMRPHFRHEKGHIHCHFDYDENMMDLILDMMNQLDPNAMMDIISTGIEHFSVSDKRKAQEVEIEKKEKTVSRPVFARNDNKEILFKVIIDGEEIQIRISCKRIAGLKPEEKAKFLNISDLISSKDTVTQNRIKEITEQILSRLSEKTYENYERFRQDNIRRKVRNDMEEKEDLKIKKENKDPDLIKEIIKSTFDPDFSDISIRNGVCPKCKKGRIVEKTNRYGKPFFGCSIFPKCNYIHHVNEYYDEELKTWVFHTRL
jgi:hypothetical protein